LAFSRCCKRLLPSEVVEEVVSLEDIDELFVEDMLVPVGLTLFWYWNLGLRMS
jgi:hypothetical protein